VAEPVPTLAALLATASRRVFHLELRDLYDESGSYETSTPMLGPRSVSLGRDVGNDRRGRACRDRSRHDWRPLIRRECRRRRMPVHLPDVAASRGYVARGADVLDPHRLPGADDPVPPEGRHARRRAPGSPQDRYHQAGEHDAAPHRGEEIHGPARYPAVRDDPDDDPVSRAPDSPAGGVFREAVDRGLTAVGGAVVDPPEHPLRRRVGLFRHDLFDQGHERYDPGFGRGV